ncbi:HTH_48 domain-containing protein [Trichonephila clavipes]|nr:HTH_48 domain-containing protein [Trichonephila clavipes]
MFKVIESPTSCEIRSVIHFLTARNVSAADIHRQITEGYGTEITRDSKVRKLFNKFKDGRTNVHEEERSGRPSVIIDDLRQAVELKNFSEKEIHDKHSFIGISRRFSIGGVQNCD